MATFKIISQAGKYQDSSAYHDVLGYCLNPEKISNGFIGGRNIDIDYVADEMETVAEAFGKTDGTKLRHYVLSFSPQEHVTADEVADIASQVADYYSDRYQIVYAVHEDTDHPHAHLAMNHISFRDGRHYCGTKQDYYAFQQHIKEVLRSYRKKITTMD